MKEYKRILREEDKKEKKEKRGVRGRGKKI